MPGFSLLSYLYLQQQCPPVTPPSVNSAILPSLSFLLHQFFLLCWIIHNSIEMCFILLIIDSNSTHSSTLYPLPQFSAYFLRKTICTPFLQYIFVMLLAPSLVLFVLIIPMGLLLPRSPVSSTSLKHHQWTSSSWKIFLPHLPRYQTLLVGFKPGHPFSSSFANSSLSFQSRRLGEFQAQSFDLSYKYTHLFPRWSYLHLSLSPNGSQVISSD